MKSETIYVGLIVASIVCSDCLADNGEVALARPVSQITIDGDFADWPASLAWYSIERAEHGDLPQDTSDFEASFRVGYDKDALYVAVEVRDDSTVIDGTTEWNAQDGCSVYLDLEHTGGDSGSIQYNLYGDGSPVYENASRKAATSSCQRSGTLHRYEWRLDIESIGGAKIDLKSGRVIGLDVSLNDKDEDASFSWVSWGAGTEKALSSNRLGDVLLVSLDDIGDVHGRIVDETVAKPFRPQAVMLQGQDHTSSVTVMSNSDGEFDVRLPAGEYIASTASNGRVERFQVTAAGETRFDLRTPATAQQPTNVPLRTVVATVRSTRVLNLHSYSWADDLRWGNVAGIAQAADGSVWFAGDAGLARFDGRSMTALEEQDGKRLPCQTIAIDRSGIVWGGGPMGIFRYDGESMIRYTQLQGLVPGAVMHLIPAADGSLWIQTDQGVSRFAGDSFTTVYECPIGHDLSTMAVESATRLWLGTPRGLIRLDASDAGGESGTWNETVFTTEDGLAANDVRSLTIDSKERLWIGTAGGLTRYDGATFKSWTKQDGLSHDTVTAVAETADGRLWVGTQVGVDEMWRGQFFHENRVAPVHAMYVDREQNVWIGGSGLFRFNSNRPWHPWPSHPLSIASELRPRRLMFTRDGVLWVGTLDGLVQCKKNRIDYLADSTTKHYTTEDGLAGKAVTSLLEDSLGGVWIGTDTGVSRFDGKQIASLTANSGLSTSRVTALAEDSTGRIWIGTSEGITIYDPHRSREAVGKEDADRAVPPGRPSLSGHLSHLTTMHGLPHNHVSALLADADGSVWIGLMHRPVCRWQNNVVQQFDGPAEVRCFLKSDANKLYAGGGDGLYHFDDTRWSHVATSGTSSVFGMAQGTNGNLWIATSAGMKVYDGFAASTLTTDDAIRWSCWDVLWDASEHAAIVAGESIAIYSPRSSPPPVTITGISADKEYQSVAEVRFRTSQPLVRFEFHGTSFSTLPNAMRYRYRLRGLDDEWKLTEQHQVIYGRLPPGQYTFEVTAIDRDLNYSEIPASVLVRVDRDYRQAALWLSLGCAIIAVAFLSTTVVRRNRGIRRLNVELDGRVKDRTAKLETETAENRKLQDQLLQAQKLDAVGTMASGIAHDFNNSLAVITGFAEIAKSSSSSSDEFIDHILTAAKQAAGTTKNLLTFSQESPGEKVPRDIVQLVCETVDFLRKMLPTSLELSNISPDNATIWCSVDPAHIQQMLVNVVMNARDALPDGGRISVFAGEHASRQGFAQLVIKDNGSGMPTDVRERIFDPFFTTKSRGQGTGLGMAIVHGIVEDHGGTIEIESSAEEGTTVFIALPRCHSATSAPEPSEPVLGGRGETILVAEDNLEVQAMLETQLTSAGFDVLTAEDGQQAIRVLTEHQSQVKLALLDIDLPKKDGKACLQEIAVTFPHLPVIMMSGLSSVDPAQLGTPFLRKPFDRNTLLTTINLALRSETDEQASGVLVIDDDDLVRLSTKAVLASSDVDVYLANDGAEAVSQLRDNLNRIGTVLLDWNLPHTDPESILRELRHVSPNVRVIIVSGDLTLQSGQIEAKGFAQLLRKPVSSSELVAAVA